MVLRIQKLVNYGERSSFETGVIPNLVLGIDVVLQDDFASQLYVVEYNW